MFTPPVDVTTTFIISDVGVHPGPLEKANGEIINSSNVNIFS